MFVGGFIAIQTRGAAGPLIVTSAVLVALAFYGDRVSKLNVQVGKVKLQLELIAAKKSVEEV